MTKINSFRNIYINFGIILFFIVLSYAFMSPLLEGKELKMPDIDHFQGMSKELVDFRKDTGKEALWTSRMFSGMPAYMISVVYPGNWIDYVSGIARRLFSVASFIFLYLIGFYILLSSLRINRWLSVAGAIAFAFSSYSIIIITAGHMSKANAIAFLPLMLAGVLIAFRNKPVLGSLLFAFSFSLELIANHLQITYYGFIMIGLFAIFQIYQAIKEKTLSSIVKPVLFLLAGAIVALGINFSRLYSTWEYSKETIRGPSELTSDNVNKTTGLDKDYVVQWSYGIGETFTLLIPNFKGGGSQINPGEKSNSFKAMKENGVQNPRQTIQAVSMYHGEQPGTSGPVYVGAIIFFLFVLGLFVIKGTYKWWLLAATLVSIVLSWGGNIMWLTGILLDYLPLYNKFRAPSMTLVIAQIAMPLLGFMALNEIINGKIDKNNWLKGLKWSVIITGGLSLLFLIIPGISGDFTSQADTMRGFPDWLIDSAIADRKEMLRLDALKSLLFISIAAGTLYAWHLKKLKLNTFIAVLGILILFDLWIVDKKYLNSDNFTSKREAQNPFPIQAVDKEILKDNDLSYRVLPLESPFQDARTSFYHKNVGGYNAAKLRRYQEVIEKRLDPEMQQMVKSLQAGKQPDSVFMVLPTINMLNTRYVIYDLNGAPLKNPHALGNAWVVSDYKIVKNADEEIAALNSLEPSKSATVDQRFADFVQGKQFQKDENAKILLTESRPNYLKYAVNMTSEQLVVFSEVYYKNGWNAYLDGKPVPHFRVNYILRGMVLPGGQHSVEYKFEPKSYYTGNKISIASSILLLLAIAGFAFMEYRKPNELK